MNIKRTAILSTVILFILCGSIIAQVQDPVESITEAELRNHIFFLASDYLNGRAGISAEYEIAAQYVASQFAAAGLEALVENEDGTKSYFQGVPFAKTTYSDKLQWRITKDSEESIFENKKDFRIMFGNNLIHDNLEIVYLGYGIEEADSDWNDFDGLDTEGKILVCISGAPVRKGKPVLPAEVHEKYTGPQGLQAKISGLFSKGAAGIIMADTDGSAGMPFEMIPGEFSRERYVYMGADDNRRSRSYPTMYLVKPAFIGALMAGNKANPLDDPGNIMRNYKPQLLKNTYLSSNIEILSEEIITTKNVVGLVPGTDPVLKNEYIVVGAHLDHVKPFQGQVCNGADDNASGSAGVIEIAGALAMNPCRRSVVFINYTAEEMGLIGSRHFVGSDLLPLEQVKFKLNMDMIGRSSPENEESRAHYVVSHKKYIDALEEFINEINDGVTDFPLIFDNDEDSPGGSDHQSFINAGIPAFFFFSGVHPDLHQPGDDAEKIDYAKAASICRLGYRITTKLANIELIPTFE
ncbi:MAG: M20/M25/M40 family metallo-hydrolase [Bacteroidales bacterium]|nr:M20/M25/M40 family metallo-hydrolase [Bacteroidales bacterium]